MSLLRDAHTFWPQKLQDGVQVFCKVYKFYVYVWNRKLSPLVAQHANTAGYWGGTKTSCVLGLAKLALLVFFWAHKYLNRQATLIDITTWPQFIGLFVVWGPVPFYKSSTTYFVYSKVFCMLHWIKCLTALLLPGGAAPIFNCIFEVHAICIV